MTRQEAQALEHEIGDDIDRTPPLRDVVLVGGVEEVPRLHTSPSAGDEAPEHVVRLLIVHPSHLQSVVSSRAEWYAVKAALLSQRHLTGSPRPS
jgi:hypothetical protein